MNTSIQRENKTCLFSSFFFSIKIMDEKTEVKTDKEKGKTVLSRYDITSTAVVVNGFPTSPVVIRPPEIRELPRPVRAKRRRRGQMGLHGTPGLPRHAHHLRLQTFLVPVPVRARSH